MVKITEMSFAMSSQPIAASANSCLAAFQELLCNHATAETEKIEQQLARFNFWAANIGVFAPSRASLDTRLSSRGGIKYRPLILQLLNVLEKNLRTAGTAGPPQTAKDGDADTGDISYVDSLQAVQDLVDRLHRLSALIRKSAARDRNSKAAGFVERDEDGNDLSAAFESNAFRIIRQFYPEASETLCRRLGESVSLRRKRVLYNRSHQVKLARRVPVPDQAIVAPENLHAPLLPRTVETSTPQEISVVIETLLEEPVIAMSVGPSETAASVPDSDTQLTIAPSQASSASTRSMLQDQRLRYPRAPKINFSMGEASCPYCSAVLTEEESSNPKLWRRHVKRDIEPYVCVAESCKSHNTCFGNFKQWAMHIQQEHRMQWHCSLPVHPPISFGNKEQFEQHLLTEHKGKFNPSRISTLAKIASRPALRPFDECPLCRVRSEDIDPAEGLSRQSGSLDRLPRHVAGHLKSLALMFLPPGDDDTEDEAGSETPSSNTRSARTVDSKDSIFNGYSLTFEGYDLALPPWEPGVEADEDWLLLSKKQEFGPEIDPTLQTFVKRAQPRQQPFDPSQSRDDSATLDIKEKATLATAVDDINAVTLGSNAEVDEQSRKAEMVELQSKLILRPGVERVALNLDHVGRELIFRGNLQSAGPSRWLETHAILFDHFLVLAETVKQQARGNEKEVYDVSKRPIPIQLLVLENTNDDPVINKGVGAVTTGTKTTPKELVQNPRANHLESQKTLEYAQSNNSMSIMSSVGKAGSAPSNNADAMLMYPFRLKHLGRNPGVYTLYAPSAQNRQDWCDKILECKTRYNISFLKENGEPFRLRVMADSAFAYDAMSTSQHYVVSVKGTPLDRAIREIEQIYGTSLRPKPVCRADVNCAATFNCSGKSIAIIGTDYGVYISEENDPRGWTRSIQISRVTQIGILEHYSLCLLIADKSLIAYHLDTIIPASIINFNPPRPQKLSGTRDVSFFAIGRMKKRTLVFYEFKRDGLYSTFKVLEPVLQTSPEKKSRGLFGRKSNTGRTEFFREYDEFYIPAECFTVNLFNEYIAIGTLNGFELLTLDKKVPMSIPDMKNPAIAGIAARLVNQKPLGMFRVSNLEFLLCYEEVSVYVDKHGEISRPVVMEHMGKAKTAVLYGIYLVLFNIDFVEVRNAENGILRQVIAGRDVRSLDYGINPLGAGAATNELNSPGNSAQKGTLKLAMAHPEVAESRIVLEMVLNIGQSEEEFGPDYGF